MGCRWLAGTCEVPALGPWRRFGGPRLGFVSRRVVRSRGTAMTVRRLAAELVDPAWPVDRPLVQFVLDWRRYPEQRDAVLASPPPAGTSEVVAAKMAAVVHALCVRDAIETPQWVHRCRLDPGIALFGVRLDSGFGNVVRERSPAVCAAHGVFFGADLLEA